MFRVFLGSLIRPLIEKIASLLSQPRIIRDNGSPYLSRYYLTDKPYRKNGQEPFDSHGNPYDDTIFPNSNGVSLYLHKFHRGDNDPYLHNHPWAWSLSFVLVGGYVEERKIRNGVISKFLFEPFSFNLLRSDTFHRVDLIEQDAWTLFLVGPKVQSWCFWNRRMDIGAKFIPWRDHVRVPDVNPGLRHIPLDIMTYLSYIVPCQSLVMQSQ